jgi:PadR family transcriptional regulator AphA
MREKSTGFVILGILASGGDLSGYEIRQWVEQAIGFFWSESFGQIYPELKRLSKAGLVKPLAAEGRGRDVKRYRITPVGRAALREWLEAPPVAERPRNELLLKLFFGTSADPAVLRKFIEEARDQASRRLEALRAAEAMVLAQDSRSKDLVFSLITIMSGQHAAAARMAWSRGALKLLEASHDGGSEAVLRAFARSRIALKGE